MRFEESLAKIRPMYFLIRYDGYDDFTQANMDTIYSAAQTHALTEIWLAATWSGALGSVSATKHNWLLARKETSGGLFRAMNHLSDLVDGTTGGTGSKCTSDGVAFDLFGAANTVYRGHCDQMTAAGWKVGSDGYGMGYPNVQNSNDMNNPAAKFLGEIVQAALGLVGARRRYNDVKACRLVSHTLASCQVVGVDCSAWSAK